MPVGHKGILYGFDHGNLWELIKFSRAGRNHELHKSDRQKQTQSKQNTEPKRNKRTKDTRVVNFTETNISKWDGLIYVRVYCPMRAGRVKI